MRLSLRFLSYLHFSDMAIEWANIDPNISIYWAWRAQVAMHGIKVADRWIRTV